MAFGHTDVDVTFLYSSSEFGFLLRDSEIAACKVASSIIRHCKRRRNFKIVERVAG